MTDNHERIGDDPQETLRHIQQCFNESVLNEIYQAFAGSGYQPSDGFLDAIGAVISKSHNEIRRHMALAARASYPDYLTNHLRHDD